MSLLPLESLHYLKDKKPLLAFSGGADSTALFFLLLKADISFDIAIVHYGLRQQADEEVHYAQDLAKKYALQCHLLKASDIQQNFEYEARRIRYDFFEDLIQKHSYTHLLTAHHLQDRLEWMLMQFTKGAGSAELVGMKQKEQRSNYTLFRPLINSSKEEILSFLKNNHIQWFHDESNDDLSYKRNYFRHKIVNELIKDNVEGIKQSFKYLEEDVSTLIKEVQVKESEDLSLFISTRDKRSDIFHIDKILKSKGYILTSAQRQELKEKDEIIAGRKFLIVFNQGIYYISPYILETMDKDFKEECRLLAIPSKLRPYLFKHPMAFILYTKFMACSI
ncbi:tRNA lysidine(34) synthetase TilS [Sulfurimonas sp. MAG313]|nr:tRNA lysidine(34) synthetase TilS [Sulfurimonas sp. MAG313]MDF1881954.1 tRNA lysidine(34) synthetase TilS [Sulfurimonas sp. MAG313]